MSMVSLILFIASGIFFVTAVLAIIVMISIKYSSRKSKKKELDIIDQIILVHTDEKIDCPYPTQTKNSK